MNLRLPIPRRSATRTPFASRAASAKLAGALLLLSGFASGAYADATWIGATSQDWNTGANWSVNPPSGAVTMNSATAGVFPIFTGSQAFTVADAFVGSGTGNTGRFDINSGTFATTGRLRIGDGGGTGTVNIAAGATVTTTEASLVQAAGPASNATLNVAGTLSTTGQVRVSNGSNNATAAVGTLNVTSGGVVNSEGDLIVAFAGNASASGTLNIAAGGTVNVASTAERWLIINQWDPTHGNLNVNGGTLNLNSNTDIRFSTGGAAAIGSSSLSLNAGAINGGATSVISLNQNANAAAVNNTLNLNGGTLSISQIISAVNNGTRVVNFNGSTVRATATTVDFMPATAATAANVKAGGAIFDTNGFDITIAETLVADTVSTGGGLTKLGAGTLTLTAVHTYTGNTAVNAGGLTLADNASLKFVVGASGVSTKITGSGILILNGDFALDLTAAGTTVGNSWQLVDAANLTETYGSTFTFGTFGLVGGKWLKQLNGVYYQFDPATGILSVINNPTVPAPTVTAKPSRSSYATGSDIQFGVSATGVGTLTYQWYFQATGASSPTLISGATSANYIVANASSGAEGVYSVIVSDSAANTPTTITFPTFTVRPGTDFTVAYYRLEGSIADSIGSNDFTILGAPTFETSVPVTTISRTGAANTTSISFPTTGNNGLVAATNSTLATTAMEDFTIEAFVRFDNLTGFQTIVGRDDEANPGQGVGGQALFYLSKAGAVVGSGANNGFRVEVITKDNVNLQVNSTKVAAVGTWYHVAVVGDVTKGTLTLYVDGISVGSVAGYTGLFAPTTGSDTPWTIGRGDYNAGDVDFLRGDLDEVRFSTTALPPAQFLIGSDQGIVVAPPITEGPANRTVAVGSSTTLTVVATGSANYEWYKNDVLIPGQTGSSLVLSGVTAASEGVYRVKAINPVDSGVFSSATATVRVLTLPAAGKRTIGLNFIGAASSANWSAEPYAFGESEVAGFYPSVNWNNSAAVGNVFEQATPLALEESTGLNPAGSSATWTSANTWAARSETGAPGAKSEHGKLIHGYIESRASTGATVTVSNIPYASYDVYIYVAGGNGGDRVSSVTINREGAATYLFRTFQNDTTRPTVTVEAPYAPFPMIGEALTLETARSAPPATFVRYTGVTGSDLTIAVADAVLNQNAGGIAAVQIVDTTPVGAAYPPTVTSAPVSRFVKGGASVSFSVAATPVNAGSLTYAWSKDGAAIPSATSATLNLGAVAGSATGRYTVTVTETSGLGAGSTTRSADLVVVDSTRSLLLNGDVGTASASNPAYSGALLPDGTVAAANAGLSVSNTWNHLATAAGAGTGVLSREASGLSIPGVTFAYAGAEGSLDDATNGAIDTTGAAAGGAPLLRDFAYTDSQTTPMTMRVGGLQAFAGHRVQLVVYAVGVLTNYTALGANDAAAVTLDPANNHLGSGTLQTDNSQGRDLRYTNAFVAFEGVVAADGTVGWSFGPDVDAGRIPANGFQLLVTGTLLAPAAPTNLVATPGNAQVGLSWTASSGASTYTILRSTTAGGPYAAISSGLATTYTDSSAVNGTTYYYVVSAVGSNAVLASGYSNQASATPAAAVSALEAWRQLKFGAEANTPAAANTADYDNDGLANLLEYALGTEPKTASASPLLTGRSGDFLTLSFPHGADSTLVYHIDSSNDLAGAWTLDVAGRTFATVGTYLHTDTVGLSTQPRRFLRLRVTTP